MSGPPSPEVTGAFCRVPSPRFSRSPRYSLPDHLCRFRVRAARTSRRCFSRQHRITNYVKTTSASDLRHMNDGFTYHSPYILARIQPLTRIGYLPASHLLPRYPPWIGSRPHPSTRTKGPRKQDHSLSITSSDWTVLRRYGNINPSTIDYACRPRLRTRLTQGRLT